MGTWRPRFEVLIDELRRTPGITLTQATLGSPTDPGVLAAARAVAGGAWPDGMAELYADLSRVDIAFSVHGSEGNGGAIHIPTVTDVWDHAGHEDELWFDWQEGDDHPFKLIRPIDRFANEAYAVLYPVPPEGLAAKQATVHYHYCGEELFPTGLSYTDWLEWLLKSRGASYWLTLTLGRRRGRTWVEENIDRVASLFPDFAPQGLVSTAPRREIPFD